MKVAVLAACLVIALTGFAAAGDELDCENAQTQGEMNLCEARAHEEADKELNAVWKEAKAAAKKVDDGQHEESLKGAEKALLDGQRGWIAYRDGQCELAGFWGRGGTMEPMLISGCKAEMTRARTKELRDFIAGP